ncbi:MAG: calcium/sodium antiporter [Myxococcota bacterium]
MELLIAIVYVILGFVALVWGADRFVFGAASSARNLGVSPLLVGLTIVAFGTTAPEILVSATAALTGNPGLCIGNAVGSNITNIALVLGAAALVRPLRVHSRILSRDLPVLIVIMAFAALLVSDGLLSFWDGSLLFGGMFVLIGSVVRAGLRQPPLQDSNDALQQGSNESPARSDEESMASVPLPTGTRVAVFWFSAGLIMLLVGSRLLVDGAVTVAQTIGVSDVVIGLSVVALGTSLPELAASVVAAYRNEHDIALGNVIGSNMFNTLGVLGLPGMIVPTEVAPICLYRDFSFMVGVAVLVLLLSYTSKRPYRLSRLSGAILLTCYAGYLCALVFDSWEPPPNPPGLEYL